MKTRPQIRFDKWFYATPVDADDGMACFLPATTLGTETPTRQELEEAFGGRLFLLLDGDTNKERPFPSVEGFGLMFDDEEWAWAVYPTRDEAEACADQHSQANTAQRSEPLTLTESGDLECGCCDDLPYRLFAGKFHVMVTTEQEEYIGRDELAAYLNSALSGQLSKPFATKTANKTEITLDLDSLEDITAPQVRNAVILQGAVVERYDHGGLVYRKACGSCGWIGSDQQRASTGNTKRGDVLCANFRCPDCGERQQIRLRVEGGFSPATREKNGGPR